MAGEEVRERQVIAIVVGSRADALRLLQIRNRIADFLRLRIKLPKIVVRVVVFWVELSSFLELLSSLLELSQPYEIGGEIGMRGSGLRIQPDGLFKMRIRGNVLRLCGVDQAKQFVDFEISRNFVNEVLELRGGFGVVPRIVLSDGRLELAIEVRVLAAKRRKKNQRRKQYKTEMA